MTEQQQAQGMYFFDPESTTEMERLIGQGRWFLLYFYVR